MEEFESLFDRLDEYYADFCNDIVEYDMDETLEYIYEYKDIEDINFLIRPIDDTFDGEILNETDEDDDFDEGYIEYDNVDDLIDIINDFDDDQLFEISIPDNIIDTFISRKFRDLIFSSEFTNNERGVIINTLMNACVKFIFDDQISESDKNKYLNFCKNCTTNDFIIKYNEDDDFCMFISDIYEIMADYIIKNKNNVKKDIKVKTINDLIRDVFIKIYLYNIQNLMYSDNDSKMIISCYFYGKENNEIFNNKYKDVLENNKIEDLFDRNYARLVLITDYIRFKSIQKMQSILNIDELLNDTSDLIFIMTNNRKNIINRFNNDPNFVYNIISAFINLNIGYDNKKIECNNINLIKKINPLYKLDFKNK